VTSESQQLPLADLLAKADAALAAAGGGGADQLYAALLTQVEQAVGTNQKDVANELSKIARAIEESGRANEAIEFKQRTCEVMLKRSMSSRRLQAEAQKTISSAQAEPAPQSAHLEYLAMPVKELSRAVEFYQRHLQAEKVAELRDGQAVVVRLPSGLKLMLLTGRTVKSTQPVYAVGSVMEFKGGTAIDLGCGKSVQLSDEEGNEFIVMER
jgi:hypothetical protein